MAAAYNTTQCASTNTTLHQLRDIDRPSVHIVNICIGAFTCHSYSIHDPPLLPSTCGQHSAVTSKHCSPAKRELYPHTTDQTQLRTANAAVTEPSASVLHKWRPRTHNAASVVVDQSILAVNHLPSGSQSGLCILSHGLSAVVSDTPHALFTRPTRMFALSIQSKHIGQVRVPRKRHSRHMWTKVHGTLNCSFRYDHQRPNDEAKTYFTLK